jgi:predicted secreted protein
LPLKSCDNLSYIHPTKEVADKFVKTIEGANADGSIFRYELAETFETTEVTTSSGNGPTLLNVKQFHSAKNEHATLPAIFLCIRFVSNQEKAAFEILQNV